MSLLVLGCQPPPFSASNWQSNFLHCGNFQAFGLPRQFNADRGNSVFGIRAFTGFYRWQSGKVALHSASLIFRGAAYPRSMIDLSTESKRCKNLCGLAGFPHLFSLLLAAAVLLVAQKAIAGGTWAPLAHPPPAGLNNSLLLSDGTVICGDGGSGWYRLTPDIHGSYVSGTWSVLAASHYTRLFYSSDILTNGNLYVA